MIPTIIILTIAIVILNHYTKDKETTYYTTLMRGLIVTSILWGAMMFLMVYKILLFIFI